MPGSDVDKAWDLINRAFRRVPATYFAKTLRALLAKNLKASARFMCENIEVTDEWVEYIDPSKERR